MKTSIFTVILSVLFASSLFGQVKVTPTLDQIMAQAKGLPALTNTNLKFKPAPKFASVQPTVDIKFSYTSCAAMGFRLNSFETKDRIFALIQLRNNIDCAGPRKTREYSLQIASDIVRKPVVVLNPVAYQFKASPIVMPRPDLRMCTQIAGVLTHKITGRKVIYSNGCQKADLLATGDYK